MTLGGKLRCGQDFFIGENYDGNIDIVSGSVSIALTPRKAMTLSKGLRAVYFGRRGHIVVKGFTDHRLRVSQHRYGRGVKAPGIFRVSLLGKVGRVDRVRIPKIATYLENTAKRLIKRNGG